MRLSILLGGFTASVFFSLASAVPTTNKCRCFPDEPCWPTPAEWAAFNSSISGRLVTSVPLGAVCHEPNYNQTQCEALQAVAGVPATYDNVPSTVMSSLYNNKSCDFFTDPASPCLMTNYVRFAIDVHGPEDVKAGIKFAKERNIRLVVRNTGHDFLGRSTGAGALSLWMHHLQNISLIDYSDPYYTGKASKIGAGVQGYNSVKTAHDAGYIVFAGTTPTVGIAGGYTQGGGHSPLSSRYGLSADQALEWEVIDGNGKYRVASRTQNTDLYWALSGGGGGTYGVVLSLTYKAYADLPTAGGWLNFTTKTNQSDLYWSAVEAWHDEAQAIVDSKIMAVHNLDNTGHFGLFLCAVNITADHVVGLLKNFTDRLTTIGIDYTLGIDNYPDYFTEYVSTRDVWALGVGNAEVGGRLISRTNIKENNAGVTAAIRTIVEGGIIFKGFNINVSKAVAGNVDNSITKAWREALIHVQLTTAWSSTTSFEKMNELADDMTFKWIPLLNEVSPGGGAYANEGDAQDPNWKVNYWGENYNRLSSIKSKYDPDHVFWAAVTVGSDKWEVTRPLGKLCKA